MARGRSSSGSCRAERHHVLVRGTERQVQEAERIEQRLRRLLEALDHGALRDLGGALAVGMAAHAVAGDQQRGLLGDGYATRSWLRIARAVQAQFVHIRPASDLQLFPLNFARFIHH